MVLVSWLLATAIADYKFDCNLFVVCFPPFSLAACSCLEIDFPLGKLPLIVTCNCIADLAFCKCGRAGSVMEVLLILACS